MPGLSERTLGSLPADVPRPAYDRGAVQAGVVHIGVGGFHRARQAVFHDRLLAQDPGSGWGICGVGLLPGDRRMRDVLAAQDGLYTVVVKQPDGSYRPRVIGAIVEYLFSPDDPEAAVEKLAAPTTRIASLTITEGAYDGAGDGPAFELLAAALDRRRRRGDSPFTVVSCDNLQGNGVAARRAVVARARRHDPALADWIEEQVAFPDSMVDRITPVTTDTDRAELLRRHGIDDAWPVVCEPFLQWVLEDRFPVGRPPYADVGVQLVDDVGPYEERKVRVLNGGHQALGYLGLLAGHAFVHEAVTDPALGAFLADYMGLEVRPTLAAVGGASHEDYERTVLERFASPEIRDTLARQCVFGSDRIRTFVLP